MSLPPPSLGDPHLPRILCLHGGGVNAEAFRLQCRGLFRALNGTFRLVFPDAPFTSPADPSVMPTYAHLQPFRRWLRWAVEQPNPGPEAICRAIDSALSNAMCADAGTGEWVALMGFSQGAKLAASLLLRQQLRAAKLGPGHAGSDFKFAVLLAGRAPLVALDTELSDSLALADADELTTGAFAQVTGAFLRGEEHVLGLPTLHVHGRQDPGLANHRRLLVDFCEKGSTRLVEWDGDHRVVIQASDVALVADEILALSRQTGTFSESLTTTLKDLPNLFQQLAAFDHTLKKVYAEASLDFLSRWLDPDLLSPPETNSLLNVTSLPFAVLLQTALFLRHLAKSNDGPDYRQTLQSLQQYGVQGFCAGFLTAAAIAFSGSEEQLAEYVAISLRLAMSIGVYIDQDALSNPVCALSVRWKQDQFSKSQVESLLTGYSHAYISCITDVTCVTVTAEARDEKHLTEEFKKFGLRVKTVGINGRFHSTGDHSIAAQKLREFSKSTKGLQYPKASQLQVPLRRNDTGDLITAGVSVTDIAIESILLRTADWYTTVKRTFEASPTDRPRITTFAFEDGILPLSLSQNHHIASDINGTNTNGINGTIEDPSSKYPPHSIAIVGMSCRFPGASDTNAFWDLLSSGLSMAREVPSDRLNLHTNRLADYAHTKFWGNFISDHDTFDHRFFKKSSREAVSWDPEKRLLLEVVYEALESAGHFGIGAEGNPKDFGCYIGAVANNYYDNVACHPPNAYSMLGTSRAFFSGRISHQFGFTGPSMTIDTACSSSLVAINSACRAIQAGECSRAIAGGTNIFSSPYDYQNLAAAGFLSSTGACKPFDGAADGYCRGEGVAAVVLKPLTAAIEEGDHVLGVIVGSAVNQNYNDAHITVPCSSAQTTVYNKVLSMANAPSSSVTYVEAHGTGTQVGDPIECQSIRDAFGGPHRKDLLHFGSVKGHIGHTEATAGVAGLVKVLLMMQHSTILGQASHNTLNPKIPALEPDMLAIAKKSQPWKGSSKLACVNSYGAAGSNAVVAVREAAPSVTSGKRKSITAKQPFFVSASSEGSLVAYARKLLAYIEVQRPSSEDTTNLLLDILFNLSDRSNHSLAYSVSKTVTDLKDLEKLLESIVAGSETPVKETSSSSRPIIMAFGGQENDFIALSEEAVSSSGLLRFHLDVCDEQLRVLGYGSLYPAIYQRDSIQDLPTLHAALFAVQYASAMSWIDSGMHVNAIVGHSFGQITALCVSGCLSVKDAMRLVVGRAELIERSWGEERGAMISVQSDINAINNVLDIVNAESPDDELEIACFNHPTNHVVVGTIKAISALEDYAASEEERSLRAKRLKVTHGFHSALTEPLLPELETLANSLQWNKPTIPIELATKSHTDREPGPWLIPHHMRNPVHFSAAIQRVAATHQSCIWVEAGQGSSVISLVKHCLTNSGQQLYCPSFLNGQNAVTSVAETVVELWKNGVYVQFWPYHRKDRAQFEYKSLPPYQFEKTKHWLPFIDHTAPEPPAPAAPIVLTHEFISFLEFTDASKNEAIFLVDPESERYTYLLNGHIASNQALAPASLYVELLSRAAMLLTPSTSFSTHVINMNSMQMKGAPIGLDAKKNIYIKLTRVNAGVDYWDFEFSSRLKEGGEVQVHVLGKVGLGRRDDPVLADTILQWSALIGYKKCLSIIASEDGEKMQGKHIYQALQKLIFFDEMYHGIKSISYVGHEAAGKVAATLDPKLSPEEALYDTPTIDGMMQFAGVLVNYFAHPSGKDVLLCQGINRIVTGGKFDITAGEWIAYSLLTEDTKERTVSDVYIFDKKTQQVVIAFIGFVFTRTSVSVLQRSLRSVNSGGSGAKPTPAPAPAPAVGVAPIAAVPVTKVAAESSKASRVREVLHNVTDVPLDEIAPDSTLEDLGIDSLLVTEVLNEMHTALGLDIELNTFLFFPNVKAIYDHVDSALGVDTSTAALVPAAAEVKVNGTAAPSKPTDAEPRPSLQRAQKVFADCKDAYERAAFQTKAVGFWEEVYPRQAALVLAYVVEAFAKLDCNMSTLNPGSTAPLISHLPAHKKLVRQLYRVLEDGGLIDVTENGQFERTAKPVDTTPASTIFSEIIPQFPLHASVHKIVQAVGSSLAECLTGTKDGLQLVFGNKDNKKTLDDLYENWPLVRSGTIALGEFLEKAMAKPDCAGKFRILEVGAGTGGTTKYIVRHLQKLGVPFEYVFTDLSSSLVAAAKRTFKDCPEISYSVLDIEKAPPAHWLNSFHVVISTNCIHATKNLTTSLTSLRQLLRDDGVLTLVEITRNMFWLDIAVGLFEGWWAFEDGREHA
ncbi:Methylphloroacetophenone synthase, partial [Lachnellula suecica]